MTRPAGSSPQEGAAVAVLDRDGDGAPGREAEVGGIAFEVDVRDADGVHAALCRKRPSAWAGSPTWSTTPGTGTAKPLLEYTDKEWALLVGVNLTGTFNTASGPPATIMVEGGGGSIVNNASLTGLRPTRGEGPYSAAKAGVLNLTQTRRWSWPLRSASTPSPRG